MLEELKMSYTKNLWKLKKEFNVTQQIWRLLMLLQWPETLLERNKTINSKVKTRAKIKWLESGDRGSKCFFQLLKPKEARDKIELIQEDGKVLQNTDDILNAFANYYAKLFTSEDQGISMVEARAGIQSLVPMKVNHEDQNLLSKPLCKEEILYTIS